MVLISSKKTLVSYHDSKIKCESQHYASRQTDYIIAGDVDVSNKTLPSSSISNPFWKVSTNSFEVLKTIYDSFVASFPNWFNILNFVKGKGRNRNLEGANSNPVWANFV